ncbi:unnamed protein product [Camellia sinensis]
MWKLNQSILGGDEELQDNLFDKSQDLCWLSFAVNMEVMHLLSRLPKMLLVLQFVDEIPNLVLVIPYPLEGQGIKSILALGTILPSFPGVVTNNLPQLTKHPGTDT